jgi:3-dehydroquinate synthase
VNESNSDVRSGTVNDAPVVILCGFMGTGKSAIGARLARRLGVPLIDTDAEVERRAGATVAAIFARDGEARFREIEREVVASLAPSGGAVIATGGGAVVDPENVRRLEQLGSMVLLDAPFETLAERVSGDARRPLAHDHEAFASLFSQRRATFDALGACNLTVDVSVRTADEAAYDIDEMLADPARIHLRVDTRLLPGVTEDAARARLCRIDAGAGVSARLGDWVAAAGLRGGVFFLSPNVVAKAHLAPLVAALPGTLGEGGVPARVIPVEDGDANKTLTQAARLIDALAKAGAARDSVVVTAGGGVTGDLGGFVAATYMRGLPWVQMPTTLLAQVDAGIGGKVGANTARAKNLAGAFYQPHLVLADTDFLRTLPKREMRSGFAEVVKTALLVAPTRLFACLEEAAAGGPFDEAMAAPAFRDRIVRGCARAKAAIVERDPYERDERRLLNLGHTLGHALEAAARYRGLRHGEAVAVGLMAALGVGVRRGVTDPEWRERTAALLRWAGLPVAAPAVSKAAVRRALALDKKRRAGALTFVLPRAPGEVDIVIDVGEDEILAAVPAASKGKSA